MRASSRLIATRSSDSAARPPASPTHEHDVRARSPRRLPPARRAPARRPPAAPRVAIASAPSRGGRRRSASSAGLTRLAAERLEPGDEGLHRSVLPLPVLRPYRTGRPSPARSTGSGRPAVASPISPVRRCRRPGSSDRPTNWVTPCRFSSKQNGALVGGFFQRRRGALRCGCRMLVDRHDDVAGFDAERTRRAVAGDLGHHHALDSFGMLELLAPLRGDRRELHAEAARLLLARRLAATCCRFSGIWAMFAATVVSLPSRSIVRFNFCPIGDAATIRGRSCTSLIGRSPALRITSPCFSPAFAAGLFGVTPATRAPRGAAGSARGFGRWPG